MTAPTNPRAARLAADLARQRMNATITELRGRVAPARLRDDAVAGLRARAEATAEHGLAAMKRQPGLTAAGFVATVVLIARRPLIAAARNWWERRRNSGVDRFPPESNDDILKGTDR